MPQYVRLPDELYLGIVADLASGWSIAGLDVKEVPTDENDPTLPFIRQSLRQGKLEPASQEEFDHIQQHNDDMVELVAPMGAGEAGGIWNEPAISAANKASRATLVQLRNADHARTQGTSDDGGEDQSEYASWTQTALREELKSRELDTTGNKRELVARLEEADAASS